MFKHRLIAVGLFGAAVIPGAAFAADGDTLPISGNLTFTSDYVFRGISQSDEKFAVQGGFDYANEPTGLYVGTWASNVNIGDGSVELDVYGGWKKSFGDFGLDLGVIHYDYQSSSILNTDEVYAGGSWKWFTAKYYYSVSDRFFGLDDGKGSQYFTVGASYELPVGVTIGASYGMTRLDGKTAGTDNSEFDYDDYKVSLGYKFKGFDLALAYTDTKWDKDGNKPANIADSRVFGSITKIF